MALLKKHIFIKLNAYYFSLIQEVTADRLHSYDNLD